MNIALIKSDEWAKLGMHTLSTTTHTRSIKKIYLARSFVGFLISFSVAEIHFSCKMPVKWRVKTKGATNASKFLRFSPNLKRIVGTRAHKSLPRFSIHMPNNGGQSREVNLIRHKWRCVRQKMRLHRTNSIPNRFRATFKWRYKMQIIFNDYERALQEHHTLLCV